MNNNYGEFELIQKICDFFSKPRKQILQGIGDDAAIIIPDEDGVLVYTTDLLINRVHFLKDRISGNDLGYKSLAVNASDIAAMGAKPKEALLNLAIPDDIDMAYLEDFFHGMKTLADELDIGIIGGDTSSSRSDFFISVFVSGICRREEVLYRNGAKAGDSVFVTGPLGDSRAGLTIILDDHGEECERFKTLVKAHNRPRPHVPEGRFFASQKSIHAAIDVSDGLVSDLGHISENSGVGIRLLYDQIPVSNDLQKFCRLKNQKTVEFAVSGGEDYVLITCIPPEEAPRIRQKFSETFHSPLYHIGYVIEENRLEMQYPDGEIKPLKKSGWEHFRS